MSQVIPPPKPTGTARALDKPSLRWRLRRWLLKRLDAWPRARPEPTTEWGRLRRRERIEMEKEVTRLRALEDRLTRWLEYTAESDYTRTTDTLEDVRYFVVDGHLDEMLAEFAEEGDELAAEYIREGS